MANGGGPGGPPPDANLISDEQRTRLWTIATNGGVPAEAVRQIVWTFARVESTKDIPRGRVYDNIVSSIQGWVAKDGEEVPFG